MEVAREADLKEEENWNRHRCLVSPFLWNKLHWSPCALCDFQEFSEEQESQVEKAYFIQTRYKCPNGWDFCHFLWKTILQSSSPVDFTVMKFFLFQPKFSFYWFHPIFPSYANLIQNCFLLLGAQSCPFLCKQNSYWSQWEFARVWMAKLVPLCLYPSNICRLLSCQLPKADS